MGSQQKYAIHRDFSRFPKLPLPGNGLVLALVNHLLIKRDVRARQGKRLANAVTHQVRSTDGYQFPVLQFNPDQADGEQKLPAILYYHGGGFMLTYASPHIEAIHLYAQRAHCRVFLVDYRLAPRHRFPKGFEDCYTAWQWVTQQADDLGVDASRIAVMGDSAGGALAAGVAQRALDEKSLHPNSPTLCGQLLIYPVLDHTGSTASATQFIDTPLWNGKSNRKMWKIYLQDYAGRDTPAYAAPANRQELHGLPPAYVETAEFDPLRDEGIAYAQRLDAAGVPMVLNETRGTIHGYDVAFDSAITQAAFAQRVKFLQNLF